MLAIRMQRTGRSGHAQFRIVVQDSHFHPTSGRVVAYLGYYNPHTKESNFDKQKLQDYLTKGAQPSARVIKMLKAEKFKLPAWVKQPAKKKKNIRFPDKRRSSRPKDAQDQKTKPPTEEAVLTDESKPKTENDQIAEPPKENEGSEETDGSNESAKPPEVSAE